MNCGEDDWVRTSVCALNYNNAVRSEIFSVPAGCSNGPLESNVLHAASFLQLCRMYLFTYLFISKHIGSEKNTLIQRLSSFYD